MTVASPGMFEVAMTGDQERQITANRLNDKITAATYDVRERYGDWLFGASSIDAFHDRVAMSFNGICRTIEPHIHARKGVQSKVVKTLEREWRERQACYPGCEKNEAHAKKFHKGEDKEARRRQAAGGYPEDVQPPQDGPSRHRPRAEDMGFTRGDIDRLKGRQGLTPHTQGEHNRGEADAWRDMQASRRHTASDYARHGEGLCNPETCPWEHPEYEGLRPDARDFLPGGKYEKRDARRRRAEITEQSGDHPNMHIQETFQDHQGENLIPEGDFHAYQDRVDQGGPEKVESHDFTDVGTTHRHDSDDDNFVPTDSRHSSREYQHLARFIQADDATGNDPNAQVGGGAMGTAGAAPTPAGAGTMPPTAPPPSPGAGAGGAGMPMATLPPGGPPPVTASQIQAMRRFLAAPEGPTPAPVLPGAGGAPAGGIAPATLPTGPAAGGGTPPVQESPGQMLNNPPPMTAGRKWAQNAIIADGARGARVRLVAAAYRGRVLSAYQANSLHMAYTVRKADRNYLQQADEALTKVLNEKAEEFQNTIAPLQQALVTIQQAEQLQNPLNVQSPAGTVNVLPQQGGQDPNAAAGGDPSGGQAPQGAGGLGADPAAAMLAGQQPAGGQQMQASWYTKTRPRQSSRGRRPLGDRRHQADVDSAWDSWSQNHTNRGDPSTYEQFAQDKGYAEPTNPRAKAIPSLQNGGPAGIPKTPSGGSNRGMPKKPKGAPAPKPMNPMMASRRRGEHAPEPGYIWSKAPASVKNEFMGRLAKGVTANDVFRQIIGEISEHHAKGIIGTHDAHRAANEAFGRLLLSRHHRAMSLDDSDYQQPGMNPREDAAPSRQSSRGRRPLAVGR